MTTTVSKISCRRTGKAGKSDILGKTQKLTSDIDGPGQGHIRFPDRTEQSAIMKQPGNAVVYHDLPKILVIQNVGINKWAYKEHNKTREAQVRGLKSQGDLPPNTSWLVNSIRVNWMAGSLDAVQHFA